MSGHVPECPCSEICNEWGGDGDHRMTHSGSCIVCGLVCICPALRACTVRVLGEAAKVVEDAHHCPPPDIVLATDGGIHCLSVTHDQWLKDLRAIDRLAQEAP